MTYEQFKRLEKQFGKKMREWLDSVATEIDKNSVYICTNNTK